MSSEKQPIVCDLTVFSAATRKEIAATVPDLFATVQKVQELQDGYAFQFPTEPGMLMKLANFVEHERQCCAFYRFDLIVEPGGGPIWLHMTGSEDVKQFMQVAWNDLQGAASSQLIQTGSERDLDGAIAASTPILANAMQKAEPQSRSSSGANMMR